MTEGWIPAFAGMTEEDFTPTLPSPPQGRGEKGINYFFDFGGGADGDGAFVDYYLYSFIEAAICWATFSICLRLAEPSLLEGVPTAINMTLDSFTAFSRVVVKVRRLADMFF